MSYEAILKSHHLSLTAVRLSLLRVLDQHPHADANFLYQAIKQLIPSATIQAVYNNLKTLTEAGIIREIKPKGHVSLYETRVDDNHHHVICRVCGVVRDTDCLGRRPCLRASEQQGFIIDEAEVVFWGTCPNCQLTKSGSNHHE